MGKTKARAKEKGELPVVYRSGRERVETPPASPKPAPDVSNIVIMDHDDRRKLEIKLARYGVYGEIEIFI